MSDDKLKSLGAAYSIQRRGIKAPSGPAPEPLTEAEEFESIADAIIAKRRKARLAEEEAKAPKVEYNMDGDSLEIETLDDPEAITEDTIERDNTPVEDPFSMVSSFDPESRIERIRAKLRASRR